MSYVEKNLISGENVVHRARLHWVVLVKPILAASAVAALGLALLVGPFLEHARRGPSSSYTAIAGVLGYGSIVVHGTGGSAEPFDKIARPLEFRHQVQQQIGNLT